MSQDPRSALEQLREEAANGRLATFCARAGIGMLVAFGSAVTAGSGDAPRDLDLAMVKDSEADSLTIVNELIDHLGLDTLDVVDLDRAGTVVRAQALCNGELLHEAVAGTFAEMQIVAMVQRVDTGWLREQQLEALTR